jgi:hypothetical protein
MGPRVAFTRRDTGEETLTAIGRSYKSAIQRSAAFDRPGASKLRREVFCARLRMVLREPTEVADARPIYRDQALNGSLGCC